MSTWMPLIQVEPIKQKQKECTIPIGNNLDRLPVAYVFVARTRFRYSLLALAILVIALIGLKFLHQILASNTTYMAFEVQISYVSLLLLLVGLK
jgi:hypothetical protein